MAMTTLLPQHLIRHIYTYMYYTKEQRLLNFREFYFKNRVVLRNIKNMYEMYDESFIISTRMKTVERLRSRMAFYEYVLS